MGGISESIFENLGDATVQTTRSRQRGHGEKTTLRSSESFAYKPGLKISSHWLFNFCILLIFMRVGVLAEILESPENQVVRANTETTLKCKTSRTNRPLIWAGIGHSSNAVSIFDGTSVNPAFKDICSVTSSAGRFDLHVKALSQLALMYKCIEPGSVNIERTAELIVLESDPTCFVESDNASSTLSVDLVCTLELSGNWIPTMTWKANGMQEQLTVVNKTERLGGQRVRVTSTLKSVLSKDKQKYLCETYFTSESYQGGASASNVPGYAYTCNVLPDTPPSSPPSRDPPTTESPTTSPSPIPTFVWIILASVGTLLVVGLDIIIIYKRYRRSAANCQCLKFIEKFGEMCPCFDWHKDGLSLSESQSQLISKDTADTDEAKRLCSELNGKDQAKVPSSDLPVKHRRKCESLCDCLKWNEKKFCEGQDATGKKSVTAYVHQRSNAKIASD